MGGVPLPLALPLHSALALAIAVALAPKALDLPGPFRSDGAGRQDPARGDVRDARRFSTVQGCIVEKSCQRSGPASRSGVGAEAGCAFFWLSFLCTSKEK